MKDNTIFDSFANDIENDSFPNEQDDCSSSENEAPVEESSETVDEAQTQEPNPSVEEKEEVNQDLVNLLNEFHSFHDELILLLKNTRNKEQAIYNVNKNLVSYKDGYYSKIVKPFVAGIVSFRESCKKSLDDLATFNLAKDKQLSHVDCSIYELEETLMEADIDVDDRTYSYNKHQIFPVLDEKDSETLPSLKEAPVELLEDKDSDIAASDFEMGEVKTFEDAVNLLNTWKKNTEKYLSNYDSILQAYNVLLNDNKKQQKIVDGQIIIPLALRIIKLKEMFHEKYNELKAMEETNQAYEELYKYAIDYLEDVLLACDVRVADVLSDTYDPKTQRIVKNIPVSEEEADKNLKVAKYITDCYMVEDKVLYPAKVNIYKK